MKKIKIEIDLKTGQLTIRPEGVTGSECLALTRPLEEKLGIIEPEREILPEMHQTTENQQEQST